MVRNLPQILCRWNAEYNTFKGIKSTSSVRESRPPFTVMQLQQKQGPKQRHITLGASEGDKLRAGAQQPTEWPIQNFNNSQRVAGSPRATVMGKSSTSRFSISSCPERRHMTKLISINLVHHLLSKHYVKSTSSGKIVVRTTHATNADVSSISNIPVRC